jgi:hypothetical protein
VTTKFSRDISGDISYVYSDCYSKPKKGGQIVARNTFKELNGLLYIMHGSYDDKKKDEEE